LTTIPTRATRLADAGLPACAAFARCDTGDSLAAAAILELAEAVAERKELRGKVKIDREAVARRLTAALADFWKVSKA